MPQRLRLIVILICLLVRLDASAQTTVSGYVVDARSGELLIGATLSAGMGTGTVTNAAGYFSLAPTATKSLTVSYLGYVSRQLSVDSLRNRTIRISLEPQALDVAEVTVKAPPAEVPLPGLLAIPVAQLKQVPMPLGETDVVKALALTPGVNVGNEGTAGLLVRGGSPDQNLIRLDEATLYNQSHLFGFAAAFNSDAVKAVQLYKGAFPARFGGRLSSILDVTMRDGNQYQTSKELNVGLLSSRLLLEGPLNKRWRRPTTYMVSARSSYLTLFLLPTIIGYNQGKTDSYFNYWLYDLNAKMTVQLDSNRRLSVSLFRGHDYWYGWDGGATERSKFGLDWGNTTGTARYSQTLGKRLFFSGLLSFSAYNYQTGYDNYEYQDRQRTLVNQYNIGSAVRDWTLRTGFEWYALPNYQVRFGSETIDHRYTPSSVRTSFEANAATNPNPAINAREQALYLENDVKLTQALTLNAGLRGVLFALPTKTYSSLEPRLSASLRLPGAVVLSTAYSQMRQFIHLLSSNVVGFPNEVWVPATAIVPPQRARQFSLGLSKSVANDRYRISVEGYRKWLSQLIDIPAGTDLFAEFDQSWQERIETDGVGLAQGLEVFVHKPAGRLNGWLAYTLAHSQRRFATINSGDWFRANYDRRHVASIVLNYGLSQRVQLSAVWQYQSGQPATVPVALVNDPQLSFYPNFVYKNRNNFQTPSYHRLDLSANFRKGLSANRQRTWTVGIINAYNRQNPLFLSISKRVVYNNPLNPAAGVQGYDTRLSQQSFLPFLPYVSFARSF